MKILHTADWHVGKVLKGRSRLTDQVAALAAVVATAADARPDLVIVAGDLFDTTSPTAEATRVVTRALSALRGLGSDVVAIAGNHDNGPALDALRPWAEAAGVILRGSPRSAEDLTITGRTAAGEPWRLGALPFVSQRYAVRASEMFKLTAAEATQTYADHIARLIAKLAEPFDATGGEPTVNLIAAHLAVVGAAAGGGEREAHTVLGYAVPATVFPASAHYVALGHLHRGQRVTGACQIRYAGSPIAVDFGEVDNSPSVSLVEVTAGVPARVTEIPISAGTPLRTVKGTLKELGQLAPRQGDAWLRVVVSEPPRAGLREEVQDLLPQAVEVIIDPRLLPDPRAAAARSRATPRAGRTAGELFSDFLRQRGHEDPELLELFHRLHDEVVS